jgi:hypothetical protein
MVGLAERARNWVHAKYGRDPHVGRMAATESYVDLIFAFGLARIGESDASKLLLQRATAALTNRDEVHTFLLQAYTYRIEQALADEPHEGTLPQDQLDEIARMAPSPRHMVDDCGVRASWSRRRQLNRAATSTHASEDSNETLPSCRNWPIVVRSLAGSQNCLQLTRHPTTERGCCVTEPCPTRQ